MKKLAVLALLLPLLALAADLIGGHIASAEWRGSSVELRVLNSYTNGLVDIQRLVNGREGAIVRVDPGQQPAWYTTIGGSPVYFVWFDTNSPSPTDLSYRVRWIVRGVEGPWSVEAFPKP